MKLDRLTTLADPLVLAGDVNNRLERMSHPDTINFGDILSARGLVQLVDGSTHDDGGTLDVVCVRDDLHQVQVLHFLLCHLLDIFAHWPRKWKRTVREID